MIGHQDDTTKPSRINRRRKKRWKISDLIANGLTDCGLLAILLVSIHRSTGFRSLKSNGVKTPNHGVFYCPKKIVTLLVRAFVMVARSGQPHGWPAPLPGTANLLRVAAQRFAVVGGGLHPQAMELPL